LNEREKYASDAVIGLLFTQEMMKPVAI